MTKTNNWAKYNYTHRNETCRVHDIKQVNDFREDEGLAKIKPKTRQCLKCNVSFYSQNASIRMCDHCKLHIPLGIDCLG